MTLPAHSSPPSMSASSRPLQELRAEAGDAAAEPLLLSRDNAERALMARLRCDSAPAWPALMPLAEGAPACIATRAKTNSACKATSLAVPSPACGSAMAGGAPNTCSEESPAGAQWPVHYLVGVYGRAAGGGCGVLSSVAQAPLRLLGPP